MDETVEEYKIEKWQPENRLHDFLILSIGGIRQTMILYSFRSCIDLESTVQWRFRVHMGLKVLREICKAAHPQTCCGSRMCP